MEIMIHPRVKKFIMECCEKERIIKHLRKLSKDPYIAKANIDIKKLKGKKHDL